MTPTQEIIAALVEKEGEGKHLNIAKASKVSGAMISRLRSGKMPLRYGIYKRLAETYPSREPALKLALDDDEERWGPPSTATPAETIDGEPAWRAAMAAALGSRKDAGAILDFLDQVLREQAVDFMGFLRLHARLLVKRDEVLELERKADEEAAKKTQDAKEQ